MSILRPLIFLVFSIILLPFGDAQMLPADAIKEDLQLLRAHILDFNPAIDVYTPDFLPTAVEIISSVDGEMSIYAAFALISQMCKEANEGHFELGNWNDPVHKDIRNDRAPFFPIAIYLVDNKIYVRGDFSNEGYLSPGDQIVSINGHSDQVILDHLRQFVPSDGNIDTYRDKQIAAAFPWMYYLYISQTRQFNIEYIPRSGEEVKKAITFGLTRGQRKSNAIRRYTVPPPKEKSTRDLYTVEFKDSICILTLKSFHHSLVDEFDVKASKVYKEIFKRIEERDIKHLVIDLRNNKGGRLEFAEEIVPYIIKEDQGHDFLVTSTSWKGKTKEDKIPNPSSHMFWGEIYVLVNGHTYSTAAMIARYLREYGDARIIGEEGGTRYEGFVAGSAEYVNLPNTGIRIGIPTYHKEFPESAIQSTENRGILPDYQVTPTIDDILKSEDVEMEYVLSMIKYGR